MREPHKDLLFFLDKIQDVAFSIHPHMKPLKEREVWPAVQLHLTLGCYFSLFGITENIIFSRRFSSYVDTTLLCFPISPECREYECVGGGGLVTWRPSLVNAIY